MRLIISLYDSPFVPNDWIFFFVLSSTCIVVTILSIETIAAIVYKFFDKARFPVEQYIIVIDVASVDEHIEKVKAAGGSVFRDKMAVGNMGFYAQVKDTEGNIIGLWENVGH